MKSSTMFLQWDKRDSVASRIRIGGLSKRHLGVFNQHGSTIVSIDTTSHCATNIWTFYANSIRNNSLDNVSRTKYHRSPLGEMQRKVFNQWRLNFTFQQIQIMTVMSPFVFVSSLYFYTIIIRRRVAEFIIITIIFISERFVANKLYFYLFFFFSFQLFSSFPILFKGFWIIAD